MYNRKLAQNILWYRHRGYPLGYSSLKIESSLLGIEPETARTESELNTLIPKERFLIKEEVNHFIPVFLMFIYSNSKNKEVEKKLLPWRTCLPSN
jgi:hypothetical protein